jgi:hypothetical protein
MPCPVVDATSVQSGKTRTVSPPFSGRATPSGGFRRVSPLPCVPRKVCFLILVGEISPLFLVETQSTAPGSSISSMTVLRLLPCTSWFNEIVTPPPSAFSMTKLKARNFGNS